MQCSSGKYKKINNLYLYPFKKMAKRNVFNYTPHRKISDTQFSWKRLHAKHNAGHKNSYNKTYSLRFFLFPHYYNG